MDLERSWIDGELLAFDLETTGIDRFDDVPVSYALVRMSQGAVTRVQGALVDPGRRIPEGATAVHGITTERARAEGMPLATAVLRIADELIRASRRQIPVVGMKLDFDLTIVDAILRRKTRKGLAERGFRGPVVDVLVLDRRLDRYRRGSRKLVDLCAHYGVALETAHEAAADAIASAQVARALGRRFDRIGCADLSELHDDQNVWHRRWIEHYDRWRQSEGMSPLADHERQWPIARDDPYQLNWDDVFAA